MKPKEFVVFGGFGGFNMGDEAILHSLRALIDSNGHKLSHIICRAVSNVETQRIYDQLQIRVLRKGNFFSIAKAILGRRLLIGGGQLLNGERIPKGLIFLLGLCLWARVVGSKPSCIGLGAEALDGALNRTLAWIICKLCSEVYCRDENSIAVLSACGCKDRLTLTADLVWLNSGLGNENLTEIRSRKSIAVAVHRDPKTRPEVDAQMIKLCQSLIERFPEHRLIALAHDIREPFDAGLKHEYEKELGSRFQFIVPTTLAEVIDVYSKSAFTVSTRMHPIILSALCGAIPVAVPQTAKLRSLAEKMDLPRVSFDQSIQIMTDQIEAYFKDWNAEKQLQLDGTLKQMQIQSLTNSGVL